MDRGDVDGEVPCFVPRRDARCDEVTRRVTHERSRQENVVVEGPVVVAGSPQLLPEIIRIGLMGTAIAKGNIPFSTMEDVR